MEGEREAQSRTVGARRPTPEEQLMAPTSVLSDTAILRPGPRLTTAWVLSSVVLVLMATSSAVGLLVEGIYPEETWAVAALRGNDLVTLVLVVPVLAREPTDQFDLLQQLGSLVWGQGLAEQLTQLPHRRPEGGVLTVRRDAAGVLGRIRNAPLRLHQLIGGRLDHGDVAHGGATLLRHAAQSDGCL